MPGYETAGKESSAYPFDSDGFHTVLLLDLGCEF
jgi:hypothetical protein